MRRREEDEQTHKIPVGGNRVTLRGLAEHLESCMGVQRKERHHRFNYINICEVKRQLCAQESSFRDRLPVSGKQTQTQHTQVSFHEHEDLPGDDASCQRQTFKFSWPFTEINIDEAETNWYNRHWQFRTENETVLWNAVCLSF